MVKTAANALGRRPTHGVKILVNVSFVNAVNGLGLIGPNPYWVRVRVRV